MSKFASRWTWLRWGAVAFTVIVVVTGVALVMVRPAAAAGTYVSRTQTIRFCVNTANAGCHPSGVPSVQQNQSVTMICWQDGSWYTGDYSTNRWFWIKSSTGVVGFLSASVVRQQTAVPNCSTNHGVTAAEAAVARYNQVWASSADKALFSNSEWYPGPVGEWSGDCVKLGYVAWHATGVSVPKNNAIQNFNHYKALGKIHSGVPPVGALAWYNIASPYGHEVVSLGDGWAASTVGMDFAYAKNTVAKYTSWANYLGWALPA